MKNLFQRQNAIGKTGEEIVKNYYLSRGKNVIDVSNDKEYQKKDIDLIINGQKVEVKTSTNLPKYNEFCIELVSNALPDRYKEGWFKTSQADILIYYSTQEKIMYQIFLDQLREYVEEHKDSLRTLRIERNEFGNVMKPSILGFIPVAEVELNIEGYRKVSIELD